MASTIYVRIASEKEPCHDVDAPVFTDETGAVVVKAKDWTPGLAVTNYLGSWQVTHRASGIRVAGANGRKHAVLLMEKLDPLADWTLDADTLRAGNDLAKLVHQVIAETDAPAKVSRPVLPELKAVEALVSKGPWKGSEVFAKWIEGAPRWLILHPSGGWMALWAHSEAESGEGKPLFDAEKERLKAECMAEAAQGEGRAA